MGAGRAGSFPGAARTLEHAAGLGCRRAGSAAGRCLPSGRPLVESSLCLSTTQAPAEPCLASGASAEPSSLQMPPGWPSS